MKLKELIVIPPDVAARLDHHLRNDNTLANALTPQGGGAYFARELEHVLTEVLRTPRAPMSGFALFPVRLDLPEGAKTYTQRIQDSYGKARVGGSYGDDPPTSDVTRAEYPMNIEPIFTGWEYTIADMAASMMTGVNLPSDRAEAALESDQQQHNDIMFQGMPEVGLLGFHTHPSIPRVVTTARPTTPVGWEALINGAVGRIRARTKTRGTGFTVMLPTSIYQIVSEENRGNGTDTTVMEYLLRNNKHIVSIVEVFEQAEAGVGGSDLISVAPLTPKHLEYRGNPWRPLPVQQRNYTFRVPCLSRSGGMHVKMPIFMEHTEVPAA